MAVILATVTKDARKYWPWFFGSHYGVGTVTTPGTSWNPTFLSFKVGCGGWMDNGAGPVPRVPLDPDLRRADGLQDIDIIVDSTRPASSLDPSVVVKRYPAPMAGKYWFEKYFNPLTDFVYTPPSTLEMRVFLDNGDFNDTGGLAPATQFPEIWELGIFSDHPLYARDPVNSLTAKRLMVAYGTFAKEIKDSSKQILHTVRLVF